ncbi:MAG: efflux RND transporter periplasmic adaptor subunit [Myxococcales bacterium]|nr:efflux RND transporter periplasmic adaptor subunit [Myxococcales bacterium]
MRYLVPIFVLLAIVGGLGGVKLKQMQTLLHAGETAQKMGPPPEVVGTAIAVEDSWQGTISAVGTVAAVRGVAVSNESPGVVTAIRFESGQVVRAGQLLVELDTSVERAQLASADARRQLAELGAGRSRALAARDATSRSQLDADEAQLKTSSADFGALKAQIDRKTVRAPFAGRLGIRTVNLGQYLQPGTPVTVLESLGSVYVDFTVPQQYLGEVKVGTPVRVALAGAATAGGGSAPLDGVIGAVDPTVDPTTRTIKLRASVPNHKDRLRPGMFVAVEVVRDDKRKVVTAPATAIVHASYGDSVFVVEDAPAGDGGAPKSGKVARQQFVRVGAARGDFVAIVDGVKAGQELVTAGAFKLRNGSGVIVNNDIKPTPQLQPNVENL